ncbi:MAG: hypothetical protein MJ229_03375 [bacterium]|nr:hypothetical protein [bacterium]
MCENYNLQNQTKSNMIKQNEFVINTNSEDIMIPYVKIIQNTSDELAHGREKYDANAKAGNFYDSITKTIFVEPKAIVCGMRKYYTEWTSNSGRGKIVGKYLDDSEIVKNAEKEPYKKSDGATIFNLRRQNGNYLIESYGAILLIKNSNGLLLPGKFVFSRSSFIDGKKLNTNLALYQSGGIPIFNMTSNLTSNSKGSWYKPVFTFFGYEKEQNVIDFAIKLSKIADNAILR